MADNSEHPGIHHELADKGEHPGIPHIDPTDFFKDAKKEGGENQEDISQSKVDIDKDKNVIENVGKAIPMPEGNANKGC